MTTTSLGAPSYILLATKALKWEETVLPIIIIYTSLIHLKRGIERAGVSRLLPLKDTVTLQDNIIICNPKQSAMQATNI